MKILVISDIHGSYEDLKKVFDVNFGDGKFNPDKTFILGDLYYSGPRNIPTSSYSPKECVSLLNEYKDKIIAVKGNCEAEVDEMVSEFGIYPDYYIELGGRKYLLCHGHHDFESLAKEKGVDVVLTGHTHVKVSDLIPGTRIIHANPGSISMPKDNTKSFVRIEDNRLSFINLDTLEEICATVI